MGYATLALMPGCARWAMLYWLCMLGYAYETVHVCPSMLHCAHWAMHVCPCMLDCG
jgi:hypothetical protein